MAIELKWSVKVVTPAEVERAQPSGTLMCTRLAGTA
jgi:hypothetical protein